MPLPSPRSSRSHLIKFIPVGVLGCGLAIAASCARSPAPSTFIPPVEAGASSSGSGSGGPSSSGSGSGASSSGSSGGGIMIRDSAPSAGCSPMAPCSDFAGGPIIVMPAPANSPTMFGAAGNTTTAGGPCLSEPADGALYPKNWLRPRILWTPATGQNLFEVRIHSDAEADDFVVYTTNTSYTVPIDLWHTIAYLAPVDDGGAAVDGTLMGETLKVTVRGMNMNGGSVTASNSATFMIAPAIADGALVYWTTSSFDNNATNTTLQGFHVSDEGTSPTLQASQVVQPVRATPVDGGPLTGNFQQVFCIGCHTATPDGNYVAFTAQWPWPSTLASIQEGDAGNVPPWLSNGAIQNLSPDYRGNAFDTWYNPPAVNQIMLGIGTFSPGHYQTGDRIYIATLGTSWNSFSLKDPGVPSGVQSQLAWFNLEWNNTATAANTLISTGLPAATPCTTGTYPGINGTPQTCLTAPTSDGGWGIIARTGDTNGAGAPSWSHNVNGTDAIAYASTNVGVKDGRMDCSTLTSTVACASDIYTVPYNSLGNGLGGAGGTAKPLPGASDPAFNEYYPAWSPDDALIAFNRVPAGTSMYNEAKAEVYVVPYGMPGAMPTAVTPNFPPPACTNPPSDGVQNTWPKWAPNPLVAPANGGDPVPTPQVIGGKTYYWVTFSSIRSVTAPPDPTNGGKRKQQLYVAGIVVDNTTKAITAYAPIYLWNQDFTVNNLIPAWGAFKIPPGKVPPPFDAGGLM